MLPKELYADSEKVSMMRRKERKGEKDKAWKLPSFVEIHIFFLDLVKEYALLLCSSYCTANTEGADTLYQKLTCANSK